MMVVLWGLVRIISSHQKRQEPIVTEAVHCIHVPDRRTLRAFSPSPRAAYISPRAADTSRKAGSTLRVTGLAILMLLLAGCGARTVEVRGSYPSPNVPPLPLTLGVYYGEGLHDFVYTELNDRGNEEYHVLSGSSHVDLFNTVLPAMFQQVV